MVVYNKNMGQEVNKKIIAYNKLVNIDQINEIIKKDPNLKDFKITLKTLNNIAGWALDGKSQMEIATNLELTPAQWLYLCDKCPSIIKVMQHSQAYADMVVAGTLFETAIGGKKIKKKIPMKVHLYENGKVVGEEYQMVEIEEETQPNPMLLKFLAEKKLPENFGEEKAKDFGKFRDIIDNMSEEEEKALVELGS